MNIIKRSGMEVTFDAIKIEDAVKKANASVQERDRLTDQQIKTVVDNVTSLCLGMNHSPNVEEIQDIDRKSVV